jgi:hypothetical protein
MAVLKKIKRAVRGEVKLTTVALEAIRRGRVSLSSRVERARVARDASAPVSLSPPFARMDSNELLAHFRGERGANFFAGFSSDRISGFSMIDMSILQNREILSMVDEIQWRRDPLSNYVWPLDYHRDVKLIRSDGSDVRVLWELNRLGHFVTLAQAYAQTSDERYGEELIRQLRSWVEQNPYGRGANWSCAMEVALRAMNLLAAFEVFRRSSHFDLQLFLRVLHQHGTFIRRNLEFSYVATSNHYLSDVAGLLWLGLMVPELRDASEWRAFGLNEMLREMDKQVLDDGAGFEASTGYHRFVLELFLYSFLLCRANGVSIRERYWNKLHRMLIYLRSYLRPDGYATLIGDTDSGQVLPIRGHRADDHAYLLAIGAAVFEDGGLKLKDTQPPAELYWLLGESSVEAFQKMTPSRKYEASKSFADAGTYIMRDGDLYLCFNASDAGIGGRGSHGHNDALSIEVSAGGRAFIVDPGTYVYSADLQKRHEFRSTSFHSTVTIDREEQNTTDPNTPFVIGNEAKPVVIEWKTTADYDKVVAEHYGYQRLPAPVTHRRTVVFNKRERCWLIDDEFFGAGEHTYEARFHFAPEVDARIEGAAVEATAGDAILKVSLLNSGVQPVLENQPVSRDYGEMSDAVSACWRISGRPGKLSWKLTTDLRR